MSITRREKPQYFLASCIYLIRQSLSRCWVTSAVLLQACVNGRNFRWLTIISF